MPGHDALVWRSTRLPPAFEHLDDDHASAAAWAWRADLDRLVGCVVSRRRDSVQEFAGASDADLSGTAGEQTVMPDAVEPARQNVEQEAANELVGGKRHDLLPVAALAAVVLVAEGDTGLVERDQTTVRDGHPVRIAREIGKNRLRSREGRLGINDPTLPAHRR